MCILIKQICNSWCVTIFRLEVHFKGYPPPVITWYRDNFEIQPSHDFQIVTTETTSKLSIPEVFPEDTGMFTVKAYNMYGMVQCKVSCEWVNI